MYRTDEPLEDFIRYENELDKIQALLPTCCECGEKIQDDYLYEINDMTVCEECLENNYKKETSDYVEELL